MLYIGKISTFAAGLSSPWQIQTQKDELLSTSNMTRLPYAVRSMVAVQSERLPYAVRSGHWEGIDYPDILEGVY